LVGEGWGVDVARARGEKPPSPDEWREGGGIASGIASLGAQEDAEAVGEVGGVGDGRLLGKVLGVPEGCGPSAEGVGMEQSVGMEQGWAEELPRK